MIPSMIQQKQNCFNPQQQMIQQLSSFNIGKWNNQQNLKYAIFMDFHKVTLSSRQKKKNFKVFQEMANFIGTRNTVQCRSHHQKLEERFKNFKKIISAVKNQIGRKEYKAQFKKWTKSGMELVYEAVKENKKIETMRQQTQKEETKKQEVKKNTECKAEEMVYPGSIYSFLSYSSLQNGYTFGIPNIYSFGNFYY